MTERLPIVEFPDLQVYSDDRQDRGFYVIRGSPRVATDADGAPQLSLVLHARMEDGDVHVHGGWVGLTTTLQLTAAEARAVEDALSRRLASRTGAATAPMPLLLAPDWLDGVAQVRLSPELTLSGTPSLVGANQATFSRALDADQAERLRAAWTDGLRDGWIRYRLRFRGSQHRTAVEVREVTQRRRSGSSFSERSSFDASTVRAAPGPGALTLEGPLGVAAADLQHRIMIVDMPRPGERREPPSG